MVWVGTSLLTRGVVFQGASTIKTGRRSDKTGPVHTHQQLAVGDMTMSGHFTVNRRRYFICMFFAIFGEKIQNSLAMSGELKDSVLFFNLIGTPDLSLS